MRTGYNQFSSYPRNPRKHPKMDIAPRGSFYKEWDPVQTGHVHQADLSFWKESPTEQSEGNVGREGLGWTGGLGVETHTWFSATMKHREVATCPVTPRTSSPQGHCCAKRVYPCQKSVSKSFKSVTLWMNLKKLQNYLKIVLRILGSDILSSITNIIC